MNKEKNSFGPLQWLLLVLPPLILVILIGLFVRFDPLQTLTGSVPPIEALTIERFVLNDQGITALLVNGGPEPVTVAQVMVDEAYWDFKIEPDATIPRLGRAAVFIPYPWVEGEAHKVVLMTNTGLTFAAGVEVAVKTPTPNLTYWIVFAVLGFYVGVVPVGLGLMWFPLLKRLGRRGLDFALALTVGLLVFLLIDTVLEGVEIAKGVPEVFQAVPMVFFAGLLSFMVLTAVSRRQGRTPDDPHRNRLWLATSIAVGIGLHNLGEGMAIGAAMALGKAALGAFLVIGFTLHNITEGVGIGAPMAKDKPGLLRLAGLALLAGGPAIVGTWIGGFAFSPFWAVLFLAIGAGAILQVVYEVTRLLLGSATAHQGVFSWTNVAGLATGIAIMYVTALLVKF